MNCGSVSLRINDGPDCAQILHVGDTSRGFCALYLHGTTDGMRKLATAITLAADRLDQEKAEKDARPNDIIDGCDME